MKSQKAFSCMTIKEQNLVRTLDTPEKVQAYLNRCIPYNWEHSGESLQSFRSVVKSKTAHCLEATFFAAAILEHHGYEPLVLDMHSIDCLDHCLFLYQDKKTGLFGTVGVSREDELYGKKASFKTVRDVVMSYYDDYIDETACLESYVVINLDTIPYANWRFSHRNVWKVENYLGELPHRFVRVSKKRYKKILAQYLKRSKENTTTLEAA
ncbi:MAG: hypothetical protein COX62_01490 [Deltaproteobacteria bacterium CG_4_10_14_0_2_um_filter_43_8]|nr:MAG: hypothetical protein COX62_01490 [Deltaproteobacteria bacterium CG_4_10_14_0_2_um_filter_43_8]